jgi:uncharacterized protein YndB with AHSA1/START domain
MRVNEMTEHNSESPSFRRGKNTFERTFTASIQKVWEEGLEAWWGPDGFDSKVRKLDLRPGGEFEIAMTATGKDQIEALKGMGMDLTSIAHGTFTEVVPLKRLAYKTMADFIPDVSPYEVGAVVELFEKEPNGVKMVVNEESMHNQQWTEMSNMGMNSQLDKLEKILR